MTRDDFIIQHKYKYYCEAVIAPNGDIEYAEPSHLCKLIKVSDKSKDELNLMIPTRASPIEWLIEYTGYGVIWYDTFILPYNYTDDQLLTIKNLQLQGIMRTYVKGFIVQEKTTCELLELWMKTGDNAYVDRINPKQSLELWR